MTNEELPVTVYSPESQLRHPGRLLREMFRDLIASRELAWRLFVRDLSARYRQTLLGYIWAFLPPLATTLTFVFLNKSGVFNVGQIVLPYAAYVMIGTLLWQVFVDAMQAPLRVVASTKAMLVKINFPREAIILAALGEVLLNFTIRLVLLIAVYVRFKIQPPLTVFLLPVGVLSLLSLGSVIGILLTPLGLLYQDVGQGLALSSGLWMLLTPVVYPPPSVGPIAKLVKYNPVSPLLIATRDWITSGSTLYMPDFIIIFAGSLLLMFVGWVLYRLAMPHLIARIGN